MALQLERVDGEYAVCRYEPGEDVPPPSPDAPFHSVTRTPEETSVVCPADDCPVDSRSERPFALLRVAGTLAFSLTGVLSGMTTALAAHGVSVFAVSTYDTDYLLVPLDSLGPAAEALRGAGHDVSI